VYNQARAQNQKRWSRDIRNGSLPNEARLNRSAVEPILPQSEAARRIRATTSLTATVVRLRERGLHGVKFVVSDDHAGLKKAVTEVLTDAAWSFNRCAYRAIVLSPRPQIID
jgi:hypothetical protein